MNDFSAGACIRFGWETFKKRAGFFIGVFLVLGVFEWVVSALSKSAPQGTLLYFVLFLVVLFISILIDMGTNAFLLKAHDNTDAVTFHDLWHPQPFWQFFAAAILTGLVVAVGFILLIIPGIIFALMLMFVKLLVIDRNLGPIEAMKESARITKGHRWELLALLLIVLVLNIVGAICLLIGLLVSIPVTALALVHAYRTLESRAGAMTPTA